ncbi:hypothetical protein BKA70DRAFT_1442969 [Coprinopsis sp. MPI-PUGE-AT-0042]|nr:hypothetical protein BKA70DRAFT_1442969 [Coprinopsis sp. MPI-PUGE-AT-0042]
MEDARGVSAAQLLATLHHHVWDALAQDECKKQAATAKLAPIHPQSTSPLFHAFPAEIRAEIFALTMASFPDTSRPKTDLALLKPCKRVYQEAKELVWKEGCGNDEETFWWGNNLAMPPDNEGDVANESDPVESVHDEEDADATRSNGQEGSDDDEQGLYRSNIMEYRLTLDGRFRDEKTRAKEWEGKAQ